MLAASDQHRDRHLERDRPRVCTRLAHTRGGVNFFGGLGGFFIRGGVHVTTRYGRGNAVTVRYAFRNVVTVCYHWRNGFTLFGLEAVTIPLLLARRRTAGIGGLRLGNALVGQRRRRRKHGDFRNQMRGRASFE